MKVYTDGPSGQTNISVSIIHIVSYMYVIYQIL